jgi:hypothetical protein
MVRVPDSVYKQVEKRPLDYFERNLPRYDKDGGEVTGLLIERPGGTTEVAKDKKGVWKMVQPAGAKGRAVDTLNRERVMDELNRLQALELKASSATPDELKNKYKITAPDATKVKVTVKKDGKETTTEYAFGKKEGAGVYAKVSGDDTIYFVPATVLDQLGKDLRDPVIFRFRAAAVRSIRLETKSRDRPNQTVKMVLENSENGWRDKDAPKEKLNTEAINKLVDALAELRADRFLDAPPTAAHKFDFKEGALNIEVRVARDDKGKDVDVYQLRLGAAEGTDYFATSNNFEKGKSVFTVPQADFKELRDRGLSYFSAP